MKIGSKTPIYILAVVLVSSLITSLIFLNKLNKSVNLDSIDAAGKPDDCPFNSCPDGWKDVQESGGVGECNKEGYWCRRRRFECKKIGNDDKYRDGQHCFLRDELDCGNNPDERCSRPTSTPTMTPTFRPTTTPTYTPRPTRPPVTPTPRVTATPTLTATPVVTSTPTITPTVTPTTTPGEPNYCGGTCGSNYNCQSGYMCYQGYCRNPFCASDSDCNCDSTPTPPAVLGTVAPSKLPKTGSGLIYVVISTLGISFGIYLLKRFKLV